MLFSPLATFFFGLEVMDYETNNRRSVRENIKSHINQKSIRITFSYHINVYIQLSISGWKKIPGEVGRNSMNFCEKYHWERDLREPSHKIQKWGNGIFQRGKAWWKKNEKIILKAFFVPILYSTYLLRPQLRIPFLCREFFFDQKPTKELSLNFPSHTPFCREKFP